MLIDCHIHIEKGEYTADWLARFTRTAAERGLDEIWLLEHCYRFREFVPMYDEICANNPFFAGWFERKNGVLSLADYLRFIGEARSSEHPVRVKFGLEVCYFKKYEHLVQEVTAGKGLDFLTGSVHFIGDFAFDHKPELWDGIDVDEAYDKYFETSVDLARSGVYTGIAHPDLIKLFGHKPSFGLRGHYDKLASELAAGGMYAEQSGGQCLRGTSGAELGMDREMLQIMKEKGVRILTASDAHRPEDTGANIAGLQRLIDDTPIRR